MTHVSRTINEKKNRLILHEIWENTDFFDTVMKLDYQTIMDNAWCLSPEKIFERCLPALSGGAYEFIDADHYDYTDFSDAKTFCTREEPSSGFNSFPFEISGLKGKVGAIRAICANSQYDCVHFFFIPADKVKKLRTEHKCNDNIVFWVILTTALTTNRVQLSIEATGDTIGWMNLELILSLTWRKQINK